MFDLHKSEILARLNKELEYSKISIENTNAIIPFEYYRLVNYQNSIKYFLKNAINYLRQQLPAHDLFPNLQIERKSTVEYYNLYYTAQDQYNVYYDSTAQSEPVLFLRVNFPKLIDKHIFIINGNTWVPTIYIDDYPISPKKRSIMLYALFSPITIYLRDARVIFTGSNIPLYHFFNIFLDLVKGNEDSELVTELLNLYKCKDVQKFSLNESIKYFTDRLPTLKDLNDIRQYFNQLFFDDYTRALYQSIYKFNTLDAVVKAAIKLAIYKQTGDETLIEGIAAVKSFIDLTGKRLLFAELLLLPIFDKIAALAPQFAKGYVTDQLSNFDQHAIVKNFNAKLQGNFSYDTTNLLSAILMHKTRTIKPNVSEIPTEATQLHETHFGKLCPITISSQEPGTTVFVINDTKFSVFGQFLFD